MLKLSELVSVGSRPAGLESTHMLSAGSIPAPHAELERIGRYRLIGLLGQGAFGQVWLADDEDLRRQVAIKIPTTRQFTRDEEVDAYLAEARALATLDHPHVVPVYDVGRLADGAVYVVSKFIDGYTLAERIKENYPGQEEAVSIVATMAEALQHAHERGLIHRDIKPANILLEEHTSRPYLADFGLAIREDQWSLTDKLAGTPAYMSPEQARRGGQAMADARSDIFSLGVVLYELLTGRRPFGGTTLDEVLEQIVRAEPQPPRELNDSIDEDLAAICLAALAKLPADRPASAADLACRLRTWQEQRLAKTRGPRATPNNLPSATSGLVGRERETADVQRLLAESRLVTLTGPGGVGKTRLSLQAATNLLAEFPDGVYFVALAAVKDPALVASAIAQAVGCRESADRPLLESLLESVANKRLLLALDNFEQVMAAAELVSKLLAAASGLRIIVTSRSPLHLSGEQEYPVSLLDFPQSVDADLDALARYSAVELFCQRARESVPGFQLSQKNAAAVVEICARLDGLPLAIELAAARIKILSPQAMLPKLRNRLQLLTGGRGGDSLRQGTLRGAIAWSHDLLAPAEQLVFRRLAVFAGGSTLEAAEAVVPDDGQALDALDAIASLVDQSLLRTVESPDGERRYSMLETVREFAEDQLTQSGESEAIRRRFAAYVAQFAEEMESQLRGVDSAHAVERLEAEHANVRTVLAWCLAAPQDEARGDFGLRIGGALWRFWCTRGYLREAHHWLGRLLDTYGQAHRDACGAKARYSAGCLSEDLGEFAEAKALYEESLAIWETAGEVARLPDAHVALGSVKMSQGDYAGAGESFRQALALFQAQGDRRGVAVAHSNLGAVAWSQADYATARVHHEQALVIRRELGLRTGVSVSLTSLGLIAARQGDLIAAQTLYAESLLITREQQNLPGIAVCLNNMGEIACRLGQLDEAQPMLSEAATLQFEMGDRLSLAYTLETLGSMFRQRNEPERGLRFFAVADALRTSLGTPLPPAEEEGKNKELDALRAALGRERFDALWLTGQAMPLAEAVAEAAAATA